MKRLAATIFLGKSDRLRVQAHTHVYYASAFRLGLKESKLTRTLDRPVPCP
jgi:hypothetical protein